MFNFLFRLFVCWCLTPLLNIWGHNATVPACSNGTLTNVLPHRNAMPQTQDTAPQPVTVYRHGADLSFCYHLMWNTTLGCTTTHFNVLGQTRSGNPSPPFHTHQRTLFFMMNPSHKWCARPHVPLFFFSKQNAFRKTNAKYIRDNLIRFLATFSQYLS